MNRRTALALVLMSATVAAAHTARAAPAPSLTVSGKLLASHFHAGELFDVEVHVTNTSAVTQHVTIMSCSWSDSWRTDDPVIGPLGNSCDKNAPHDLALAPGDTDTRILPLATAASAHGEHHFRLVFTPIGGTSVTSAAELVVAITEVSTALAIAGTPAPPRGVAFKIANSSRVAVAIASQLTLEHEVNGGWEELGPLDVNACHATPACRTIAPGGSLVPRTWTGYSCAQCICHASALAPPGDYRVVAHSCAAGPDFISAVVSPGPVK